MDSKWRKLVNSPYFGRLVAGQIGKSRPKDFNNATDLVVIQIRELEYLGQPLRWATPSHWP